MKNLGKDYEEIRNKAPTTVFKMLDSLFVENADSVADLMNKPLDEILGGGIFLVESEEDLKEVPTTIPGISLFEKADSYDICEVTPDGLFVTIVLITNNSGGNTYMIPIELANTLPNVLRSIELTKNANNP
jgi:hypothetical protein